MSQDLIIRILADGLVVPVVIIGAYALIFKISKKNRIESYKRIIIAGLTAYLFAKLVGVIYQPEYLRPFEMIGASAGASFLDNPGFPSDHTLFVVAITCAVWFETKNKLITVILLLLVVGVSVGRVLALVHTPIDILGGIFIAMFGSIWYLNK
ncbi:MAG TPA: phosphatase PAP2 family protein [Candidatus Saccharibacteria bacterium]|nr:phosphatase PAP2 family protein [Candidatus Saccharibacteria bacterium]